MCRKVADVSDCVQALGNVRRQRSSIDHFLDFVEEILVLYISLTP